MIVKKPKGGARPGNSFGRLARYITRSRRNDPPKERHTFRATNLGETDSLDYVIAVVHSQQALSTNPNPDKSYHLVVSFHPDDKLDSEMLKQIEARLCAELGFSEHQRISVLHQETTHQHLHIAINKVHPETLKTHTPWRDYVTLGAAAAQLEIEFGLKRVERGTGKDPVSTDGMQYEAVTGQESLASWARRVVTPLAPEILARADNWPALHTEIAQYGLQLETVGRGLCFVDKKSGARVKASSVHPEFSKAKLVARYGAWVPPIAQKVKQAKGNYADRPLDGEASDLWGMYQHRRKLVANYRAALKNQRLLLSGLEKKIARTTITKLKGIKQLRRQERRAAFGALWQRRQVRWQKMKEKMRRDVEYGKQHYSSQNWQSFLIDQAVAGNKEAMQKLRSKNARAYKVEGVGIMPEINVDTAECNKVGLGRRGAWRIERAGGVAIHDEEGLRPQSNQPEDVLAALLTAIEQGGGGRRLALTGTPPACAAMIEVAVRAGVDVSFSDEGHEARRRILTGMMKDVKEEEPLKSATGVAQWIKERNDLRPRVKDMLKHVEWSGGDLLRGVYKGIRNIGNVKAALIEANKVLYVVEIPRQAAEEARSEHKVGVSVVYHKESILTPEQSRENTMEMDGP